MDYHTPISGAPDRVVIAVVADAVHIVARGRAEPRSTRAGWRDLADLTIECAPEDKKGWIPRDYLSEATADGDIGYKTARCGYLVEGSTIAYPVKVRSVEGDSKAVAIANYEVAQKSPLSRLGGGSRSAMGHSREQ